jgi:hypothetical protein
MTKETVFTDFILKTKIGCYIKVIEIFIFRKLQS